MGIQVWAVLGLMTAVMAKFVMPVDRHGWSLVTVGLGVGGAVAGGLVGVYGFRFGDSTRFDVRAPAAAVGGAVAALAAHGLFRLRRG